MTRAACRIKQVDERLLNIKWLALTSACFFASPARAALDAVSNISRAGDQVTANIEYTPTI
jgi:hypothetical protein